MMDRGAGPVAGLIVGSVLAAGGCGVAFWLGKPIRDQAEASTLWPAAEGRIVRSSLVEVRNDGKTNYSADIGYEYDLDGKTLTGTRVWFGDDYASSPGSEFRSAVRRYPVGQLMKVYYDPADPATSVLERGATWSSCAIYFVGLGMLAAGATILLVSLAPLVFIVVAMAASCGAASRDELRDFDRHPPGPTVGSRDQRHPAEDDGADDGITIG